jgi:PAS domain S-box-containing protein
MRKSTILLVEDEFITAASLSAVLTDFGFEVVGTVDRGEEAIIAASELSPNLILMDIVLNGEMNGITAATIIKEKYNIPIIYLTGQSDDATVNAALDSEPFGYIIKPFEEKNLKTSIKMALYKHAIDEKLRSSERTNRVLLNAVPDPMMLLDQTFNIIAVNNPMALHLGTSQDKLKETTLSSLANQGLLGISMEEIKGFFSNSKPDKMIIQQEDRWFELSIHRLTEFNNITTLVAIQYHDVSDYKKIERELSEKGFGQIEHNMNQFQILNDEIRNPLQIISLLVSFTNSEYEMQIYDQITHIDNLVTQLDKGWVESEKVRQFLLKHYEHGIGTYPDKNPDN